MEKKVIMLACAAGMSTSLLVSKMQKAATEKGFDAEIFAVAAAEAQDYVEKQHVDVVLLGPQVRFMEANDEWSKSVGICRYSDERIRAWTRKRYRRS